MKKVSVVIAATVLLIACGSSVESNLPEAIEKDIENVIATKFVDEEVSEEIVTEVAETVLEEIKKEASEQVVNEETPKQEETNEEVSVAVKEVVTEVVEEEKPVLVEKIRAKHLVWNGLTKKHVTASGKVNYKGMKTDLPKITGYLDHLKNIAPKSDWSKNEKLAYWINLYNASTVYLIASNYPTSSITKLNGGKPWDKKFVKSGSNVYSLNDIENNIVRPRFKDPRIHAALNCAAVSCPKMLNGAFLPSKLSAQLDKQCRAWVNDVSRNEITVSKLKLSQIFDWYKVDFKAGGGVVAFISKYNNSRILIDPKAKTSYLEYNWNLNE